MNKYEYLNLLSNQIRGRLPMEEYNNVMQYYDEYFQDAGPEKEQEVINELGTPYALGAKILADYSGRQTEFATVQPQPQTQKKGLPVWAIVLLVVCCSPMLCGVAGAGIGVIGAVAGVFVAIAACAVGLTLGGIVMFVGGVGLLFSDSANGLLCMGAGFVCVAVGIGFVMLTVLSVRLIMNLFSSISKKSKRRVK